MISEFTNEEIVTRLLCSNEILRNKNLNSSKGMGSYNFLGENKGKTLGDYLISIPAESDEPSELAPNGKYVFIR